MESLLTSTFALPVTFFLFNLSRGLLSIAFELNITFTDCKRHAIKILN